MIGIRGLMLGASILALALLSLTLAFADGCGDRINTADALALSAKPYTISVTGTTTTATGSVLQHTATVTEFAEGPTAAAADQLAAIGGR